ncbi:MAG: Lrp/AsnC family transcriptional regulator [Thermoplasmataceae archaeon]
MTLSSNNILLIMQGKLDAKDILILNHLKQNGRDKISEISSKLDIPRATVFERMEKLRREGFIKRYTLDMDYDKLGFSIMSYILIEFDFKSPVNQRELVEQIARLDNVISASIIAGNWDIIVLAVARNMKELSELVLDNLKGMKGISKTLSVPVFEHIK